MYGTKGKGHIVTMGPRTWVYYIREALGSIYRNGWMSFVSIGVVALTLMMLGSFMLLNLNVEHLIEEIKDDIEIIAYVDEALSPKEVDELRVRLIQLPDTEEVRFVSKDDALERLREKMGDLVLGYGENRPNPLRDSFEIRTIVPEDVPAVARQLQSMPGIATVDYGTDIVEKLFNFTAAVKWVGLAFMIGLGLTAAFLIANTIKLTVNARASEIMIMKYVGATEWFIRWPFLIEGILLGLFGALLPTLALMYLYEEVYLWASVNLIFLPLMNPGTIFGNMTKLLMALGGGIGCVGSLVSMRRFLKV